MALAIRLQRGGAKKRPHFRIVVADNRSPRDGRFIETLGYYNPMVAPDHPDRQKVKAERAKYWIDQGAKPSDRVHRILSQAEVLPAFQPPKNQTKKNQPKAKAQERAEEERKRQEELRKQAEEARKEQAEKEAQEAQGSDEGAQAEQASGEDENAS
ncbi:MAG: 30S ribosomal protein S16 [Rhodovibrio sp.]|nr:30S ribosomal protein S16 [Rhodovibrio sp.]